MFLIESMQYNVLVNLKKVMLTIQKGTNWNKTTLVAYSYKDYKREYPIILMTGTEEQCTNAIKKISHEYQQKPLGRCQI